MYLVRQCIGLQGKRILGADKRWSKNEREKKLVQHVVQHFLLSFCWTKRIWSIDGRTTAWMFMLPMFRCCLHLGLEVGTAWEPGKKVTKTHKKRLKKFLISLIISIFEYRKHPIYGESITLNWLLWFYCYSSYIWYRWRSYSASCWSWVCGLPLICFSWRCGCWNMPLSCYGSCWCLSLCWSLPVCVPLHRRNRTR